MEKRMNDKVNALRDEAGSQEKFMKQLAALDENGTLTDETMNVINGGGLPDLPPWFGYFLDQIKGLGRD